MQNAFPLPGIATGEQLQTDRSPFRDLARAVHVPAAVVALTAVIVLLLAAILIGLGLSRIFRRYALRFENNWGNFIFSLLASLPTPLLILVALYTALEQFSLPHRWEHLGSQAILITLIAVMFYFPAKVILLFVRRIGQKQP